MAPHVDMLRVEFQIGVSGIVSRFLGVQEIERVEVDNAFPLAGGDEFLFLTVQSESGLSEEGFAANLPETEVAYVSQTSVSRDSYYLGVVSSRPEPSVLSLLVEHRAIPHQVVGQNRQFEVVVTVRDWQHLKQLADVVEDVYGSLELVGTTQTDHVGFPLGSDKLRQTLSGKLSDQQLAVLETAYRMGFFTVPQEVTAADVASELGIGRSTLSERLHRVQHNLCRLLFGAYE
jgi:predicted DNA binding protein